MYFTLPNPFMVLAPLLGKTKSGLIKTNRGLSQTNRGHGKTKRGLDLSKINRGLSKLAGASLTWADNRHNFGFQRTE